MGLVAAAVLWAGSSVAYDTYTGTICSTCHSGFQSKGPLHDTHTAITGTCGMCHPSNPGSKPVSTWQASDATAYSCLGCHGRDYGGGYGKQAAGLRAHHAANGVTVCGGCHSFDPVPLSEATPPPHYSRPDVDITGVCADNLDNDGDDLYDDLDTDCIVPVESTTWGRIKQLYR
jgi:nitrate/TMAO reductase-like tetraheme cytochrome c subunit